ncbi:hypothetical protein [Gracilimonas sediminicola]|uniref:Uncharacterized protein n=1 Tax=Gracilimonas sediminicola TaxID=2952158 RepID=A0A9X2L0P3_9BACT|nr:hypothetical protein [Gracilimonas sediminicola]MCP9290017.1 hypothetical protein [Gracilimonas sediminicola]
MAQRKCVYCNKPIESRRIKYCSDVCQFRFTEIKKEEEKHLPPPSKRNENYFHMYTGSELPKSGQGKRSGGMVEGAMSSIRIITEEVVEVNRGNLQEHFSFNPKPTFIRLGNEERVKRGDIEKRFGIEI